MRILTVVEPDIEPQVVVQRATWLAEHTGAELTLMLCDADVTSLASGFFVSADTKAIAEQLREAQREILEDLAEPSRKRGIDPELEVLEERPIAEAVIARALEIEPSFVVKGTQYHSYAQRAIFVDTDWQLLRACPFPLWMVKPREMASKPLIAAAVDPTHEEDEPAHVDHLIVKQALAVSRKVGGEVHLVHSYQPVSGVGAEATKTFKPIRLARDELRKKTETNHRDKLAVLAESTGIAREWVHLLPGAPRDVLAWFAREHNVDVLVMGAVARWSLQRAVIGSTAEKVMDHLPCDILIVRATAD